MYSYWRYFILLWHVTDAKCVLPKMRKNRQLSHLMAIFSALNMPTCVILFYTGSRKLCWDYFSEYFFFYCCCNWNWFTHYWQCFPIFIPFTLTPCEETPTKAVLELWAGSWATEANHTSSFSFWFWLCPLLLQPKFYGTLSPSSPVILVAVLNHTFPFPQNN